MSDSSHPDVDLTGFVDLHIHAAPDVRPRKMDDIDTARAAAEAGMAAIVLKSHVTITADRAQVAQKMAPGIRVFGGVALNEQVGGLNPFAVEAGLKLGAAQVWMPTFSAQNMLGPGKGIAVLDENGALKPVVPEILKLIAEAGAILGTGHLSVRESLAVVEVARKVGVKKIVVTHPEASIISTSVETERELAEMGVFFERCWNSTLGPMDNRAPAFLAERIRAVGPASTIISTDLGQSYNPAPVDGFRDYIAALLGLGITWDEVKLMGAQNPATLLGMQ